MADSYYTVIRGKKYDRRMLELADGLTKGRGDGRISVADAKTLLRVVKDSNNYSATEKATMEYIRKRYKFTKEGDEYFRAEIRKWAGGKGKKAAPKKEKKSVAKETAATAPVSAPTPVAAAEPYSAPAAAKKSSPWKEIFIGLILLIAASALFYFIAFKTSCGKAMLEKDSPPVTEAPKPAVPPVASEAAKPVPAPVAAETAKPAPAPVAAKPVPKTEVAPDLKKFIEGTQLIFIAEKSELTPTTLKKIDALAERLKGENLKLQLTGHTCSLGPKELNQKISEKRASVAKEALVARGVPAANIETRGIADSEKIGDQKTVAGRVASRRVTFKVLQ
jgi:outer membrane protein OmpA-like peptidoglycan-associated protein